MLVKINNIHGGSGSIVTSARPRGLGPTALQARGLAYISSSTFGGTEGSLAFGQAYRGALPPLPPIGVTTTSAQLAALADVKGGCGGKAALLPAPPTAAQRE